MSTSITTPTTPTSQSVHRKRPSPVLPYRKQIVYQIILLLITFSVLFPILWIVSLSLDPRGISRPTELRLIPPGASLDAFKRVMDQPTNNKISFTNLALNSFKLALGTAFFSVAIGVSAAYVFSRFKMRGLKILMVAVLAVLMMPAIGSIAPLYVLLNKIKIGPGLADTLRNSLYGVGLAVISGALPFAIWNLKGYVDTIPRDLEEAARIDGASVNQTFIRIILPLATPALAVTAFLGFLVGWTEFAMSWQFLSKVENFTLSMALWNMTGQYSGQVPWSNFAAMALLVALPVSIVYLFLQKYIVSGLTIGGVKG